MSKYRNAITAALEFWAAQLNRSAKDSAEEMIAMMRLSHYECLAKQYDREHSC